MAYEKMERRSISASLRSARNDDDDSLELRGLAVAYNSPSKDLGGFIETVAPAAFKRCLADANTDVRAFWNHDNSKVLARQKNGTLKLTDAPEGLRFVIKLDRNQVFHRDLHASIKRGDVNEVSFGFSVPSGGDKWEARGGKNYRTLQNVLIHEISPVTFAAYNATSVQARSLDYVLGSNVLDAEWESIRARIRAIGMKVLEDRQGKVEDMTLRARVEELGRELRREERRERLQLALKGFEV